MRGQRNDNPACGTDAGYRAHGKNGTPRCDTCKRAHAKRRADYRKQAYLLRGSTLVDGCGTRRRIQALSVIGYSLTDLAAILSVDHAAVANWGKGGRKVLASNAQRVSDVYERLSGTPGCNRKASTWARSRGWAGPLDWNEGEIDDPRAVPYCEIEAAHEAALTYAKWRRKAELERQRLAAVAAVDPAEYERRVEARREARRQEKARYRARAAGQAA